MDRSVFEVHWKRAVELCPSFEQAGIKADVCGPESFTPDHKPLVGEDPIVVGNTMVPISGRVGVYFKALYQVCTTALDTTRWG